MGNKVVTVPYQNDPSPQTFAAPKSQDGPNSHHAKTATMYSSSPPSECPMHQANKDTAAGCPIKGESDINPNNMVFKSYLKPESCQFNRNPF